MPAQSNKSVHWICREHETGAPDDAWPGHLHQSEQTPNQRCRRLSDCRFYQRQAVCPANCPRATHPHLARPDEWDYATNDAAGVTPDNRLFGARDVVSWLCAEHGPYPLEIRFRTRLGQGCPIHSKLAAAEKRRAKQREIDREQRSLAERARQRLRSGDADNVIPL